MTAIGQRKIEALLREAYSETHEVLNDPELGLVVKDGLLISYGPPIHQPDLLLVSFQGGGADRVVQETWPRKLIYLDSSEDFGKALRTLSRDAGLLPSLQSSTMALPTVFPQARKAERWERGPGPYSVWRDHSVGWVQRLAKAIRPKVVIVFGVRASRVFDIRWKKERRDRRNWPTFGVSTFQGAPAVYCQHLSQGYEKTAVLRSLKYAKRLLSERKNLP